MSGKQRITLNSDSVFDPLCSDRDVSLRQRLQNKQMNKLNAPFVASVFRIVFFVRVGFICSSVCWLLADILVALFGWWLGWNMDNNYIYYRYIQFVLGRTFLF